MSPPHILARANVVYRSFHRPSPLVLSLPILSSHLLLNGVYCFSASLNVSFSYLHSHTHTLTHTGKH